MPITNKLLPKPTPDDPILEHFAPVTLSPMKHSRRICRVFLLYCCGQLPLTLSHVDRFWGHFLIQRKYFQPGPLYLYSDMTIPGGSGHTGSIPGDLLLCQLPRKPTRVHRRPFRSCSCDIVTVEQLLKLQVTEMISIQGFCLSSLIICSLCIVIAVTFEYSKQ